MSDNSNAKASYRIRLTASWNPFSCITFRLTKKYHKISCLMANTKSALKNIRKNKVRYIQNRTISSRLKTLEKKFLNAVSEKDNEGAKSCDPISSQHWKKPKNQTWCMPIKFREKISLLCFACKLLDYLLFKCDGNHSRLSRCNRSLASCG